MSSAVSNILLFKETSFREMTQPMYIHKPDTSTQEPGSYARSNQSPIPLAGKVHTQGNVLRMCESQ